MEMGVTICGYRGPIKSTNLEKIYSGINRM